MLGLRQPGLEYCVCRAVSSHSSHHPQEVLLAQFSLCVHEGGLKPDSFHFPSALRVPIFPRLAFLNFVDIEGNNRLQIQQNNCIGEVVSILGCM